MELRIGNEQTLVQVLPEKAMLIPEYGMLVISDLHLGKDIHFRNSGIPIPSQVGEKTFSALDDLLTKYTCHTILFLGDLFHSIKNKSFETFASWIDKWKDVRSFKLILGNHDMYPAADYERIGLQILSHYKLGSLLFEHQPRTITNDYYHISGHIHPAVRLKGKGKQSMKLPCFWFTNQFAILPAFGHFTGTYVINPSKNDRIFVIADGLISAF
jgi:DNA ligase-associated metallophosphoesterase